MTLRLLLILGALSAFGPLAIDLYLPTFPTLARDFGTDVEHIQLSLASYFVGLAIGQLLYGPLVDRFGRRLPLLIGVALFCLTSLALAFAPSLAWMIGLRFAQAFGGSVGMVASRTVVRDLCDPATSAKVFSQLMLVMGLAPILAPLLGGYLLVHFGWPSVFVALAGFSAVCVVAVALWLPETYPADMPRASMSRALPQYVRLFRERPFIGHALGGGFAMAGMFSYIAGSPFVIIELYGVSAQDYGWLFGANAASFILMAQFNARAMRLHDPRYWLVRWSLFYPLAALVLLGLALAKPTSLWPLMVAIIACTGVLGGIVPNAAACALARQRANAGSASALLGSLQFTLAALAAALIGVLHDGSAVPMALVIAGCALGTLVSVLWAKEM